MKQYQYVIIGGGLTADAAVRGIREMDKNGSIAVISTEKDPPYVRPNLSKGLWKGKSIDDIWCDTKGQDIDLFLDRTVQKIDTQAKAVRDDKGDTYGYGKLLLATGGRPNRLPFGDDYIVYYRDLEDYRRLREMSDTGESFLVIGGGFIGTEIAAALTMAGKSVTMVFPEEEIGVRVYPKDLSQFISDYYREKGVVVVSGDTITSLEKQGKKYLVRSKAGKTFEVDGVVAGIGIHPNTDLAEQAGLKLDNGIVVDNHLKTSNADIYAAGDVANFFHPSLEKRVRVEHEDNATQMGKLAGRNMAGANETYAYAPMFYSDLFDLGYEAVGELSSSLDTVADWKEPFRKGVVYYTQEGRVRGVLLWNVWEAVDAARALLLEGGPFSAHDLTGKL